jgi:sec-independent protein translocase protein TatB
MFDIGFSELILVALVALIVIGPERLPRVARTVGALLGRAQRYVNDVKSDIQREVDLDELKNVRDTFQDAARSVEQSAQQVGQQLQAEGESLNQSVSGLEQDKLEPAAPEPAPDDARGDERPAAAAQMDLGLETGPGADPAAKPKA